MYQEPSPSGDPPNAWSILSNTERWIHRTLAQTAVQSNGNSNPYVRKEVSYVCEPTASPVLLVAAIFRQLQDMRRRGETHIQAEVTREAEGNAKDYQPRTLRQTQVMVIPSVQECSTSFACFDTLVQAINQSRRAARDWRTAASTTLESERWSMALHCAHLHPSFGEGTDTTTTTDAKDLSYQSQRLAARRSPYPTLVLEVRAAPTPESFAPSPGPTSASSSTSDIQRQLEALFGQSAHLKEETTDSFWDALGNSLPEVTTQTPLQRAQHWMATTLQLDEATVTTSDATAMDEAYAFLFTNIAMFLQQPPLATDSAIEQNRSPYFLVLPQLFPSSATSLERWAEQVGRILAAFSSVPAIQLTCYHPEHVRPELRAPTTMIGLGYPDDPKTMH